MRLSHRAHPAVLVPLAALALAGCSGTRLAQRAPAHPLSAPPGQVTVQASDSGCALNASTAPAGVVTFDVTNTGSKVTEFYVYAEGDRILGEVENIGPGLSRQLKVEVTEPATLTTACKPGMVGDGIRNAFAITGQRGRRQRQRQGGHRDRELQEVRRPPRPPNWSAAPRLSSPP